MDTMKNLCLRQVILRTSHLILQELGQVPFFGSHHYYSVGFELTLSINETHKTVSTLHTLPCSQMKSKKNPTR